MTPAKRREYLRSVGRRLDAILLLLRCGDDASGEVERALRELHVVLNEDHADVDGRPEGDWFARPEGSPEPVGVDSSAGFYNAVLRLALARAGCDDEAGAGGA